MIRDRARLASAILGGYLLFALISNFVTLSKLNQPITTSLLRGGGIFFLAVVIFVSVIAWGLWGRRRWGWQLGIAVAVIKLVMDVKGLIPILYSLYSKIDNVNASSVADLYWTLVITTVVDVVLLVAFLRVLLQAETRSIYFTSAKVGQITESVKISGIGLINISLALAFVVSWLTSVGGKIFGLVIGAPLLQSIPPYQAHLFNVLANYWIPAILIFLILRMTKLGKWLNPTVTIQVLLGVANILMVLYLSARVLASGIQGGGPSFVVMQFAPIVVGPAMAMLAIGLALLFGRAFQLQDIVWGYVPLGVIEKVAVFIMCTVPIAYGATFYFGESGSFRFAREAREIFEQKCTLAGEKLPSLSVGDVQGLYLDNDWSARFDRINDGVFIGYGGGVYGEPWVNSGWLLFFEKKDDSRTPIAKYKKYSFVDGKKWVGVDVLSSKYGVFVVNLVDGIDPKLKVGGARIQIVDLGTQEVIASSTYFVDHWERKFCGVAPNGYFDTGDFIRRALGLKMQYPSAIARANNPSTSPTSMTQRAPSAVELPAKN